MLYHYQVEDADNQALFDHFGRASSEIGAGSYYYRLVLQDWTDGSTTKYSLLRPIDELKNHKIDWFNIIFSSKVQWLSNSDTPVFEAESP